MKIRDVSESEREEIEEYLFLDDNDLYSLLPAYSEKYKGTVFAPEGQIKAGKEEFKGIQRSVHSKICLEWQFCQKADDALLGDYINLVVVIADLIAPVVMQFPPFIIASILVKIGIRKFCNCS